MARTDYVNSEHTQTQAGMSPIAIIGYSGRFPGEASDSSKLWELCSQGRDAWTPIPATRFNHEAFYHPDSTRNGSSNVKGGFFLEEDLARFDAPFFGFTKAEAASLDPEQRLLLECAYETLEDAGVTLESFSGSETGVYVGTFLSDWGEITRRDPDAMPLYQPTGSGHSMLAGRLSYFYNLKGPSMTVDTACSASFVALHNACSALRNGDCTSALVGGVNSILNHDFLSTMSSMQFLSPDGRSYSYDERANGYARGEGVVTILIKPLDEALRDGDSVRGIIRGIGLNQDGKTPGITHPSQSQQAALIRKVYERAGLDPNETSYVETHGTGTQVGDVIEAKALYEAFGNTRTNAEPLLIGSIKTNIGHLEGASGLAGLVKVLMMLENELILPNSDFIKPNERIKLNDWHMEVPTQPRPWKSTKALRASINNFGYAGTNAHLIVESARSYLQTLFSQPRAEAMLHRLPLSHQSCIANGLLENDAQSSQRPLLFALSAFDEHSNLQQVKRLSTHLQQKQSQIGQTYLRHLASTLAERRSRLPWKTCVVASSTKELISALEVSKSSHAPKVPSLGFVFTGQGAQWYGMGRELFQIREFRDSLDKSSACLKAIDPELDVITELSRDEKTSRINEASISQPLCTILQIALVDLLHSWDITPSSVVGHSSGEMAAAYTAGLASRRDAITAAYYRGLLASSSNHGRKDAGGMAAIPLPEQQVTELLAHLKDGEATIACYNSPSIMTVSGDDSTINEMISMCKAEDISARKLLVDVAYHSSRMRPLASRYIESMRQNGGHASPIQQTCDMFSTVTGAKVKAETVLGPDYWAENLCRPVRFSDALIAMCTDSRTSHRRPGQKTSIDCLIEIGPHGALAAPIRQILQSQNRFSKMSCHSILTRYHNALDTALHLGASLFEKGYAVAFRAINGMGQGDDKIPLTTGLPSYPWNHESSYWAEPRASKQYRNRKWARHDLLGAPVNFNNDQEPRWRNWLRCSELPWLRDHRVNGLVVYPAAGYIAMAIEAARQQACEKGLSIEGYQLRDLRIGQALVVPESTEEVETMLTMRPYSESAKGPASVWKEFTVSSASESGSWSEHCRGLISIKTIQSANEINGKDLQKNRETSQSPKRKSIAEGCNTLKTAKELYKEFDSIGLEYHGVFANVVTTAFGPGQAHGQVVYPDISACMAMNHHSPFVIHPALLDSTFQVACFAVLSGAGQAATVPTFISHAYISEDITRAPGTKLSVDVQADRLGLRSADILLDIYDDQESSTSPKVSVSGLTLTSLTGSLASDTSKAQPQVCHTPRWRPDPDLLKPDQLASYCEGLRVDGPDDETLKLLDEATFYMAEEMLQRVSKDRVRSLSQKSQRLYESFERLRDRVHADGVPRNVAGWTTADAATRSAVWEKVQSAGDEGALYLALRANLHRIILEETDPLSVVMEGDVLGRYYAADVRMSTQCHQAAAYIDLLANKNPHLKILEIGAGTGGATIPILRALGRSSINGASYATEIPRFQSYDITDITTGFFEKLKERTKPWIDLLKFGKLNIEQDPGGQGYELESYDLVVASNVLHATERLEQTLSHVKKLLKPGGKLVLVELMRGARICTNIFGIFDGWWIGASDGRIESPLLDEEGWDGVLQTAGFSGTDFKIWDLPNPDVHQGTTIISTKRVPSVTISDSPPVVVVGAEIELDSPVANRLKSLNVSGGDDAVRIGDQIPGERRPIIVIAEMFSSLLKDPTAEQFEMTRDLLSTRDVVLWVTRGATLRSLNPDLNLVSGLFATLRAELGGSLVHLDLDTARSLDGPMVAEAIIRVYSHITSREGAGAECDMDFVERDDIIMIRRFENDVSFTQAVSSVSGTLIPTKQPLSQNGRPLKLGIKTPGLLDSLFFDDDEGMGKPPQGDELDIEIHATALNFRDVMMAMGQIETYDLGAECSGTVSRVGPEVKTVRVGDRVVAQAFGTFSTFARTREMFTSAIPPDMSMEDAATLPIVYTTALYSIKVARLAAGETVLIHCAAGGLGQALIMLCQLRQVEIYVTVGTIPKKEFMMERYSIPESHIFSSRDTSFKDGIIQATNGRGIDVIFNSLSSDLLRATWACIAPFGRFIELGKRDFAIDSRLEMAKFARNVTFAAVDLAGVIQERPEDAAVIQQEAIELVSTRRVQVPKPVTVYGMDDLETALRTMQTGRHMGKLVIKPKSADNVPVLPQRQAKVKFLPDASYLIVGGLGGIGRSWARRMIHLGARSLIFMSPSGARKPAAKSAVEEMRKLGATISVFECDVSDREQLSLALARTSHLPPIRGIFHSGSNFRSEIFKNMGLDAYEAGIRPKVHSTWNLHDLLPKDMDYFVFFSSATSVVGNAGQAAYSAASAFQDAFADYRNNTLGLPAISIDLGVIGGIGHVAEHDDVRRNLDAQGYKALSEEECMDVIEASVTQSLRAEKSGNVIAGLANVANGSDALVYRIASMALLRRAAIHAMGGALESGGNTAASLGGTLRVRELLKKAVAVEEVENCVEAAVVDKLCSLLMVTHQDIDTAKSMSQHGLDSLIAVEMRNWISSEIEVTVPVLELLGKYSIQELSKKIAHQTRVAKALGDSPH